NRGIEIGKQTIAQLEIFSADRLNVRVVQFAWIRICGLAIIADLIRSQLASIPSPGQAQLPVASMRAKQWTKRAELEPAHIKFARKFFCRDESPCIGSP